MAILYVETNFPVGIAEGQDGRGEALLDAPPFRTTLVIPAACFMEALSVIEFRRRGFDARDVGRINRLIDRATRDRTSPHAIDVARHLQAAKVAGDNWLNDVRTRLDVVLKRLVISADVVQLSASALDHAVDTPTPGLSPTDQLILSSILDHAQNHAEILKAFLSGDKHFHADDIRKQLRGAGIKTFRDALSARGWLDSQARGGTPG